MTFHDDKFLNRNWGLQSEAAQELFHNVITPYRRDKGINDPHTHLSARQIVENEPFPHLLAAMYHNADSRWKNLDHYLAQAFVKTGVPAGLVYENAVNSLERWTAFAEAFPRFAGNHAHTWAHMELRDLGIDKPINADTAQSIWNEANDKLKKDAYRPQGLLNSAGVRLLCTTDDPIDDLYYHQPEGKESGGVIIKPTFRPDKYMHIFNGDEWRKAVRAITNTSISGQLSNLVSALQERHDFFATKGCIASDHGLPEPYGYDVSKETAEKIFSKVYFGSDVAKDSKEAKDFMAYMMQQVAGMNAEKGWVTQIHFGTVRNVNTPLFEKYGADTGGDVMKSYIDLADNISPLLSKYADTTKPHTRVALYSLNPTLNPAINMLDRAFSGVYWGIEWWVTDTHRDMKEQIKLHATGGFLTSFAGMHCDGRKLTSLRPRYEVFERAAADALGDLVEQGVLPMKDAEGHARLLTYDSQAKLFKI
jgi:glucuronate isomerase